MKQLDTQVAQMKTNIDNNITSIQKSMNPYKKIGRHTKVLKIL